MRPADTSPGTKVLLAQLRAALADDAHSDFLRKRLSYAILQTERRLSGKKHGKLPVIPKPHKQIIACALERADVEAILGIPDSRGRKDPEENKLRDIYEVLRKETGDEPSIRQVTKRARREGLHVSRDRAARLFPEKRQPRINVRKQARRFVDLSLVHFDQGLTVLGFVTNDVPSIEVLSPTDCKMSVMLPAVPSSADRARVLEFNRIVALITQRYPLPATPDWKALLTFIRLVPAEKLRLFYIAGASEIPQEVKDALRVVSAGARPVIRYVKTPNYPLIRMLSREFALFGAGWFPTLGDTLERLEDAFNRSCSPISLAQTPVVRDQAIRLRLALERKFESMGIHLFVGPKKAERLGGRSSLGGDYGSGEPALREPMPIDFPLFQIADSPVAASSAADSDCIALSFDGVEEVLSALPFKHLEDRSRRIIELQDKFLATHAGENMLNCAAFFQRPGGNFLGPEYFSELDPNHKLMSDVLKTFWSVLLLGSFDSDTLFPPNGIGEAAGRCPFAVAYLEFYEKAVTHVNEEIRSMQRFREFSDYRVAFGEDSLDDLLGAVALHMIGRITRIWKAGLDEATERSTIASLRAVELVQKLKGEVDRLIDAFLDANDPAPQMEMADRANALLARFKDCYKGIWPTVTVSRLHLKNSIMVTAKRMAKHQLLRRGKGKVVPGVNTLAFVSAKEKESGSPGVEEEKEKEEVGPQITSPEATAPETLEELLRERLQSAGTAMGGEEIVSWWRRFLTALRLSAEQQKPPSLGRLEREIPQKIRSLLKVTGREFSTNAWKGPNAKKLHKELEAFLASRSQVKPE